MSRFAYGSLANAPLQEVVRLTSRAETWAGRFDGMCCPLALCAFREHSLGQGLVLKGEALYWLAARALARCPARPAARLPLGAARFLALG